MAFEEMRQVRSRPAINFAPGGRKPFLLNAMGLLLLPLLLIGCEQRQQAESKPRQVNLESVTICRSSSVVLLQLLLAENEGLFSGQGLKVAVQDFAIGKDALEAMLNGECEFAFAAEPPIVEYALKRDDFRILSALQSSDNMCRIVARADRGIAKPSDLRGKRVGTVKGTAPHYFLEQFLEKYLVEPKTLTIEFMKADDLPGSLASGQVDAIAMTNKGVWDAARKLGADAVVMEAPGLCRNYYIMLATTKLLKQRPEMPVKFLRALAQADDLIAKYPDKALSAAAAYQKVSPEEARKRGESDQYRTSLEHAMLMGLDNTARWYLHQKGDHHGPIPNFLYLIYSDSLRAVKPEAINLVQ